MEQPPQHRAPNTWTWLQTADPAEMILAIYVETQKMTLTNKPTREVLALGTRPYAAPTKFKDLSPDFGFPQLNHLGVADWEFVGELIGSPTTTFHFFKNKTPAEALVPYDIQEKVANHYWDEVIYEVFTEADPFATNSFQRVVGNDIATVVVPKIYIRALVLPGATEGTRFVTRLFQSARRPNIPYLKFPQPMEMDVRVCGERRIFERALHPEVLVAGTPGIVKQYLTVGGTGSTLLGSLSSQKFPATNFPARKRYVLEDDPERTANGIWHRKQVEVIPPKIDPETLLIK